MNPTKKHTNELIKKLNNQTIEHSSRGTNEQARRTKSHNVHKQYCFGKFALKKNPLNPENCGIWVGLAHVISTTSSMEQLAATALIPASLTGQSATFRTRQLASTSDDSNASQSNPLRRAIPPMESCHLSIPQ